MPDIIETLKEKYATNQAECLNMLPELFKQHDEGLIKVLPCKVGDTVYHFGHEIVIDSIESRKHGFYFYGISNEFESYRFCILDNGRNDFGKTVFLTREEAEKALNPEAGMTTTEQRSVKSNEQS